MLAKEIMKQTIGDSKICIAVLDGPIDLTHPCFNESNITQFDTLVPGCAYDGPSAQHGTHVASLIFGQPDSPICGISPGCRGISIPVFKDGPDGLVASCSQIDLAHAITQAVEQGAHIINISGGELIPSGEAHPLLDKAVSLCTENGVLIVAAVGNDGCKCLHVPAAISSTLAVGAMNAQGFPLDYSNWGETYQQNGILALGENLLGAVPGGGVKNKSGSSFATPIVSGIVALLLSIQIQRGENPDPHFVKSAILQSVNPCFSLKGLDCSRYLRGRLNIDGAYNIVTKRQQTEIENNNSFKQIQGSTSMGLREPSKRLPILGANNVDFSILNKGVAIASTKRFTPEVVEALEDLDSNDQKLIDNKNNKQKNNQIQKKNMTMVGQKNYCLNKLTMNEGMNVEMNGEKNEFNNQTELTASQIKTSKVQPNVEAKLTASQFCTFDVPNAEATESTVMNPGTAISHVTPSQSNIKHSKVYAIGTLSYDFGTEARRDFFTQSMEEGQYPSNQRAMIDFLDKEDNQEFAAALIWTLNIEGTPVYAIQPHGSFSNLTYKRLRKFLREQLDDLKNLPEGSKPVPDRVSIPGIVLEKTIKLFSGQRVPIIIPELRGMWNWHRSHLISAVTAEFKVKQGVTKINQADQDDIEAGISDFLDRVYYELMNLGVASSERAINYVATNLYQIAFVYKDAYNQDLVLDKITTVRSPICRPDSDCWDVIVSFFNPSQRLTIAKKVYRLTVDVSDIVPVTVGTIRSWSVYD
jgi:cyanobactin maturation PatA/PatG family protease